MKLCPSCDRHLFGPEPTCPFCGAEQATTAARPGGALASLTLAFALGAAACGPVVEPEQAESSSAGDETTGPPGTTVSPPSPSTTTMTTVDPDTDDGPIGSSTELTTTGDDADDAPCAFYAGCPPDVNTGAIECDVLAQDCPEGEKCMPWANDGGTAWNATRCSPVADAPDAPGEPCTVEGSGVSGIDSCDVGVMCFHVDPRTNEGTCVSLCTGDLGDPQCAAPEQACVLGSDGLVPLCFDACHPLDPTCDAGTACYPTSLGDQLVCLPPSGEDLPQGEPCDFITSCAPGLTCLDASLFPACAGAGCCTEFCDLTAGLPCPDADQGVECVPWYEEGTAPAGHENLGACVIPP